MLLVECWLPVVGEAVQPVCAVHQQLATWSTHMCLAPIAVKSMACFGRDGVVQFNAAQGVDGKDGRPWFLAACHLLAHCWSQGRRERFVDLVGQVTERFAVRFEEAAGRC